MARQDGQDFVCIIIPLILNLLTDGKQRFSAHPEPVEGWQAALFRSS